MLPDSANAYPSGDTESIWMGTAEVPDFAPLDESLSTDVGAGIAGLTTAYLLTKAGKDVVALDDGLLDYYREVSGAASGRVEKLAKQKRAVDAVSGAEDSETFLAFDRSRPEFETVRQG